MTRYEPNIDSSDIYQGMVSTLDGDYVEYSDVKALQNKLDNLFRESMKIATKAEDLNKLQSIYFE